MGIADRDDLIGEFVSRNIDHAFTAFANSSVAAIAFPDVAAEQRWRELHHRVPAHRHDVRAVLMIGGYEDDRPGFEMLSDPDKWKVVLLEAHCVTRCQNGGPRDAGPPFAINRSPRSCRHPSSRPSRR